MNKTNNGSTRFYFSLFRAMLKLRGGDARRSESNGSEARLIGLMMYSIHYLFFAAKLIPIHSSPWVIALVLIALAFWIWIFWLLLLYLNSIIIRLLRCSGFIRTIPDRRAQGTLFAIITTAMALDVLNFSPWIRELGAIWLLATAMNLGAALILAFSDASRPPGK